MKIKNNKKVLIILGVTAIILGGGIGYLGALNGWWGGGGSIPSDTFTRGLVGYWSMDEGSGTTSYDASGNGNDGALSGGGGGDWLSGWDQRVKITIDQTDIDAALSNFPVLLYLSSSSGRNAEDITFVFDEIGANKLKIAVTTSDGTTQCYVEIEKWDDVNEKAWLWVKVPSIVADVDTDLYLYYDNAHADNTGYVGDTNSTPAMNVWDSNFMLVHHLIGADATALDDSTTNNNDVTSQGGTPEFNFTGEISGAVDLEYDSAEYLGIPDSDGLDGYTSQATFEFWVKPESLPAVANARHTVLCKYESIGDQRSWFIEFFHDGTNLLLRFFHGADGINYSYPACIPGISVGTWYHIVIVWRNNGLPSMYVDAVSKTVTGTYATSIFAGTAPLDIGRSTYSPAGRYLDGTIDEIRISNTGRLAEWVTASHETQIDHLLDWDHGKDLDRQ